MRLASLGMWVGLLVAFAASAAAQEKTDAQQIVIGIAFLTVDSEYALLEVDGQPWESFYYEDEGLTAVLEEVDRTKTYTIRLTPTFDEIKFAELSLGPKDWKLVRLDKETRQWQARKKLKFARWKPGEKEKWEADRARKAAEEDAKKPPEDGASAPEAAPEPEAAPQPEAAPEPEAAPAPEAAEPGPEKAPKE